MPSVIKAKNLANETRVEKRVREKLGPLIRRTRRERHLLNEQWIRYDNLWKVRHDSESYHGRIRANFAIGRRVIENWVTKLKNDLFPDSGKWFQIHPESRDSEEGVEVLAALFRRFLWDHMRVRRKSGPILRQLVTLGTAPVDIGWRYSARDVPTLERVYKESGGNLRKAETVVKQIVDYIGPTCRPVDLFRWYVYPASVNDVADLTLIFEDVLLDKPTVERMGRTWIDPSDHELGKQFENIQKALELFEVTGRPNGARDKFQAERERLSARGLQSPVDTPDDPNQLLVCTKSYWRISLEDMEENGETVDEDPRWYQIVTTGDEDVVLQVRPVVFWDGEPSYLAPKFVEVWEEFYGYGVPGTFDSLAYLTNDVLNQGADALTFSLNPIAAVDPGAVQDMTTVRMRPGAKWLVRRPRENVQFMEPPKDSAVAAGQAVQQFIGLINDAANVAPFSGGGILGPRARGRAIQSASGMAMVASENLVQVHDVIQGIEDLWLDPMLKKMHGRIKQCLDRPIMLNIAGAAGAAMIQREVSREDVIGEYTFRWQASITNYNMQVRGQQMIGFFQQVSRLPPELLAQENARISMKYLLRAIWSEGLQLPEAERLIEDIQPVRALDAQLENELYEAGRPDEVKLSPADEDLKHIQVHDALLKPGELDDQEIFQKVVEHIQEHLSAMVAKQVMQQMQSQGQLGGPGGMPGGPPQPSGMQPPQNPGRMAQTGGQEDLNRTMDRPPGMEGAGGSSTPTGGM